MDIVGIVALWGSMAGLVIGLAMAFFASPGFRAMAEGQLLRFGAGGMLFMLVWFLVSTGRASEQVEIGIGVLVLASLVAGIVLSIARRMKAGV